ncbi:hypothetical protein [Variovorax rhizosphaerae]|uniref:Uncharacterized protein n=1 Tax=Variovorax rhizosphaerae TaxID=1836200 RepID=A0ABU8WZ24_9BURK
MKKMKPIQDRQISLTKLYTFLFFVSFGSLALSPTASAGAPAGPYIVWFNLDEPNDKFGIDNGVRAFLKEDEFHCDGRWYRHSSILFMKKNPP